LSPAQEEANVAWHSARKLEDSGAKPKAMRLQVPFPPVIDFGRFAAQRRRPTWVRRINRAAGIPAQLARKAEQQQFLFAALCRLTCLVQQTAPVFV
jgi:hypothetical protein